MRTAILIMIAATALLLGVQTDGACKETSEARWDGKTLTVHEWGTFTTVQGSDGVVLDGLSHEERDLPGFVYDLRDYAGITGVSPKMETPVIYFYSEKAARAEVQVKFPRGVITQWYPGATGVNHQGMTVNGASETPGGRVIGELKNGYINWGARNDLQILAPGQTRDTQLDRAKAGGQMPVEVKLPEVEPDDPWRFCREVDANTVRVCSLNAARKADNDGGAQRVINEYEKCLFYRGLGDFPLPLTGKVKRECHLEDDMYEIVVDLTNANPEEKIPGGLILYKRGNRLAYHFFGEIEKQYNLDAHLELEDAEKCVAELIPKLAQQLVSAGLYDKEAYAMARTWQDGYFRDDGLRVLYILPEAMIDRELPLTVTVEGAETPIKRVFVGRTELLSPTREAEMEALVSKAASGDISAMQGIADWGRFAAPYLRRVLAVTKDERVKAEATRRLDATRVTR